MTDTIALPAPVAAPASTPIADYGLLADCNSAALVDRAGSIDWLCLPRYDSAAIFARILGSDAGSYWGCIPSKTLLRPGEAVQAAREVPGAREAVTGALDVGQVLAWRDFMVSGYDDAGQASWAEGEGIAVLHGTGRLDGPGRVIMEAARTPRPPSCSPPAPRR